MTISEIPASWLLSFVIGYCLAPLIYAAGIIIWDTVSFPIKGWLRERKERQRKEMLAAKKAFLEREGLLRPGWTFDDGYEPMFKRKDSYGRRYIAHLCLHPEDKTAALWLVTSAFDGVGFGAIPCKDDYVPIPQAMKEAERWANHAASPTDYDYPLLPLKEAANA